LGINRATDLFSCWICSEKGSITKLIRQIEDCSWSQAKAIKTAYTTLFDPDLYNDRGADRKSQYNPIQIENTGHKACYLPRESTNILPTMHRQYLTSRRFDPDKLQKEYHLRAVYNIGQYRGRLIIPCFLDGKLVSYLTRDITNQATIPYIDCPESEAIIPVKHTLYNIDNAGRQAVLVEGVTDVWRLGPGSIGSFTSNLTSQQKLLLVKRGIKKLFVLYDPDAFIKAKRVARDLSVLMSTEIILLDKGDPADLSQDSARILMRELLG